MAVFSEFAELGRVTHTMVRVTEVCAGLLFLYLGVFLYKDEDGRIQNALEAWWLRLSYKQSVAISRNVRFVRIVAGIASEVFDRMFGNEIFSSWAVGASVCFSLASWLLFRIYRILRWPDQTGTPWRAVFLDHPMLRWLLPICMAGVVVFLCLGLVPIRLRRPGARLAWLAAVLLLSPLAPLYIFSATQGEQDWSGIGLWSVFGGFFTVLTASFLCDIFFVALTRLLLRDIASRTSLIMMLGLILLNCLLASLLVAAPYALAKPLLANRFSISENWLGILLNMLLQFNLFEALVSLLFVFLTVITVLHLIFWPTLNRSLYALTGLGIAKRRKLMGTLGVALLAAATGQSLALMRTLLDIFAGK